MSQAGLPPAVLLAAGESSRFWPLSTHGHKSLHRLCGKSIIEHTVESLATAGVTDIIVVQSPIARVSSVPRSDLSSPGRSQYGTRPRSPRPGPTSAIPKHRTIADQLGDGRRYGVNVHYIDQQQATGPGPALKLAARELSGDFFVVYPESINAGEVVRELWQKRQGASAVVAGQKKSETWLFGVFALAGGLVTDIVEKPATGQQPSQVCNMGIHLLGDNYLRYLGNEADHEICNIFALRKLAQTKPVRVVETDLSFFPLKYPWHLFPMADHLKGDHHRAHLGERVRLAKRTTIGSSCVIESDCVIGDGVVLKNCLIGAGSRVGSSMSDSILGAAVTIAPDVDIRETLLDRGQVVVDVKGHAINTGLTQLGAVIGQGTKVETEAVLAPGVLVGAKSQIAAGAEVTDNVPDYGRLRSTRRKASNGPGGVERRMKK